MHGPAGTAERFPTLPARTPAETAALAAWLIDAPGQSPAWRHYMVSIIHLRPIEGAPPAHVRVPGATHEMLLCALDSDEQAIRIGELATKAIVDGVYPAEPPFAQQGREMWQQIVTKTAEHARTGGHLSARRN